MHSLTRRALLRRLGVGSAGLALASCQPKTVEVVKEKTVVVAGTPQVVEKVVTAAPAPKTAEKVTLRYAPWPGAPSREPQKAVVDAFNQGQDRITVKEEEMGGEGSHYQKLKVRAAAGVLPDMAFMQGSLDYFAFILAKLLLPIDDMIAADPTFKREERIAERAEPIFNVLGRTWGLPVEAASWGIYYNKTLFDEAGVEYPKPGWTWEDFLVKAKALTKGSGAQVQWGYLQGFGADRLFPWMKSNGGSYFSSDVFPMKQAVDTPEVAEALQFLQDLVWKHKVAPVEDQFTLAAGGIGFDTGHVAMNLEGNWRIPGWAPMLKQMGVEWDVAPLPKKTIATNWLSVDIAPIFASTKYPEECFEFIKFWNKEGQPYMLELWGRMPVIPNAETKAMFQKWVEAQGAKPLATDAFWNAWEIGYIWPITPAWSEINSDVLVPAIEEILQVAGTQVEPKLKEIAPKVQKLLDEKGQPE